MKTLYRVVGANAGLAAAYAVTAKLGLLLALPHTNATLVWFPAGVALEVQGPKREFLLPFIKQFVREVRRDDRVLVVVLPEGLLD